MNQNIFIRKSSIDFHLTFSQIVHKEYLLNKISSFSDAFQYVKDNLAELENSGAQDTDLVFLKGLLDNPAVSEAIKVSEAWTIYVQLDGKMS